MARKFRVGQTVYFSPIAKGMYWRATVVRVDTKTVLGDPVRKSQRGAWYHIEYVDPLVLTKHYTSCRAGEMFNEEEMVAMRLMGKAHVDDAQVQEG